MPWDRRLVLSAGPAPCPSRAEATQSGALVSSRLPHDPRECAPCPRTGSGSAPAGHPHHTPCLDVFAHTRLPTLRWSGMKGPEDGEAGRHGQQLGWGEQAPGGETESAPPNLARSQHGVNATSVKARKGFKWVSEPLLVPRGPSLKKETRGPGSEVGLTT